MPNTTIVSKITYCEYKCLDIYRFAGYLPYGKRLKISNLNMILRVVDIYCLEEFLINIYVTVMYIYLMFLDSLSSYWREIDRN